LHFLPLNRSGAGLPLLHEDQLPVLIAKRGQVTVIGEIEDLLAEALIGLAGQERQDVVTSSLTGWQTGQLLSDRKQIHSAICRHQSPL
jgi:hypothetical protein